jgi:threonine aldolase
MIDLRSDTVTQPTPEMRTAMYEAEVGDDVFGEDPSINALEEETADLLGKEAAIYVPSGTMSNQIGIWINTRDGDEVILERECHVYNYEAGGPGVISRVQVRTIPGVRGMMTADQIRPNINPVDLHRAPTSLVCIENTHNRAGGAVYPIGEIEKISDLCAERGIRLHLDGARLWNATAATGIAEKEYAALVDTVSVCFSKGLGAPVGSALVGSRDVIEFARRKRKLLGGGMRQAGVIASGALYAIRNHRPRLVKDHENAAHLAEAVNEMDGFSVDVDNVETNILFIEVTAPIAAADVVTRLNDEGVAILALRPTAMRAVTHLDVSREDIDKAIDAFARVSKTLPAEDPSFDASKLGEPE